MRLSCCTLVFCLFDAIVELLSMDENYLMIFLMESQSRYYV